MNPLTVGQRAPLSNLAIDDTVPITLKFTRQSSHPKRLVVKPKRLRLTADQ
ncbi:hypothetical protein [Psychrobacter arcticus]|uniref:hypothetical protein n=1 Tax=Psychrobacter arcticus TaxID=334543 RepID=UPI0002D884DA|nr:hypothetical protein [Psychrobacter arcticus]